MKYFKEKLFVFFGALALLLAGSALADGFVQAGALFYNRADSQVTQVITVQGSKSSSEAAPQGFLILVTKSAGFNPQTFSLKDVAKGEDVRSVFVAFNEKGVPSSLIFSGKTEGDGDRRTINGSATLEIADRVFVTYDSYFNYLSITSADSLLTFVGMALVYNGKLIEGDLLSANSYSNLVKPYKLTATELLLEDKPLPSGMAVGVPLSAVKNQCGKAVHFITERAYSLLTAAKTKEERLKILREALLKGFNPLRDSVQLRSDEKGLLAFNTKDEEFLLISPITDKNSGETLVCVAKSLASS